MSDSQYDDAARVRQAILRGRHRQMIGGMWEEIGRLQLDFLVAHGLQPHHRLIDIGCGALRGGVKIIPYLDPGNYWGMDRNAALIDAGWDLELTPAGLTGRQPRQQLVCLEDFEFDRIGQHFDFAIAQSVFTHLSLNRIRRCLIRLAPWLAPGGRLYASFFELHPGCDREQPQVHQPGGATSHSDRSFYHYDRADFAYLIRDLPLAMEYIGGWGHPRGQHMLGFVAI